MPSYNGHNEVLMADEEQNPPGESDERSSSQPPARNSLRKVEVKRLDTPPSLGKKRIHPRRPAPIVPAREQKTIENQDEDKGAD